MSPREDVILQRLRELDDPVNLERPAGFDLEGAEARFSSLRARIERDFDCECRTDAGPIRVQDASYYGDLIVPAASTHTSEQIWIRISNFGELAMYALDRPGSLDPEELRILLDTEDKRRIESALADTGYFLVPEELLWDRYDGRSASLRNAYPDERPPTWFIRYFDYL
jgi:hypothetical protein